MYAALAETLETPLTQIEIVETVGSAGTLELLLISNHFQIEPRFTAGLLRSPINQHWAPYFAFVVTVITSQSEYTNTILSFLVLMIAGFIREIVLKYNNALLSYYIILFTLR